MSLRFWVSPPEFLSAQIQSLPRTVHRGPTSDVNFLCWQALVDMNLNLILRGSDCILLTLGMIMYLGSVPCRNVSSYVPTLTVVPSLLSSFFPGPSAICGIKWNLSFGISSNISRTEWERSFLYQASLE